MPARLSNATPGSTDVPPIQLARTGMAARLARAASCSALRAGSVMPCGARIASKPSHPGSRRTVSTASPYRDGSASPRISTGLPWLQCGGSRAFKASIVAELSAASSPPAPSNASVASTPGPPALVTIARRRPRGRGCLPSTSAISNSSAMRSTRKTPQRRKAASRTSSLPVSAPVCDAAALAAAAVRPALMTMMGLARATSRAAERNSRGLPIDSMYSRMLRVCGSSPK